MLIKNKITKGVTILSACFLIVSCQKLKEFGDTNVNPNGSTTVNTGALLTNVEANLGGNNSGTAPGLYAQYFTEATYPGTGLYSTPNFSNAGLYSGILNDCQKIINFSSDPATAGVASANGNTVNQIAVAKILKSYIFWTMTDRWGDIPYTEALQGANALSPKYDPQLAIYQGIIADLTLAINSFSDDGGILKGDVIFPPPASDPTPKIPNAHWKRVANSIRMLMALRLSERFPGATEYAAVEFAKAYNSTAGYINTNADNFVITYPGANIKNPYYGFNGLDNGVSNTFTNILTGTGDTRVNAFTTDPAGIPYGLSSAASPNNARIMSATFRAENAPLFFITAAQCLLAKAEAIELGWLTGLTTADAKVAYEAGITASFAQWGVTMPAGFLSSATVDYNLGSGVATIGSAVTVGGSSATTSTKLQRIYLQEFIAFYPDGTQGWSNWRRTDFPVLKPTVNAKNTSKQIVRRYQYAPYEYSLNSAQLAKQIAAMGTGGDSQDTHVWWDK
jgi:hypothetical protein